jgi:hypothetical protein
MEITFAVMDRALSVVTHVHVHRSGVAMCKIDREMVRTRREEVSHYLAPVLSSEGASRLKTS